MLAPIRVQVDIGRWKFQAILCHESHLEDEEAEEETELSGRLDCHLAFAGDDPPYFGFSPIAAPFEEEE